jgi:hypothetical protein
MNTCPSHRVCPTPNRYASRLLLAGRSFVLLVVCTLGLENLKANTPAAFAAAGVVHYTDTLWDLQKKGEFNAGSSQITWTLDVIKLTTSHSLVARGYVDVISLDNGGLINSPITGVDVKLRVGNDSTQYVPSSVTLLASDGTTVLPPFPSLAGSPATVRIYYVARFSEPSLPAAAFSTGASLTLDTRVDINIQEADEPGVFIPSSVSASVPVTVPAAIAVNGTVTLTDPVLGLSIGGIVDSLLNQNYSVHVDVLCDARELCNTATLTGTSVTLPVPATLFPSAGLPVVTPSDFPSVLAPAFFPISRTSCVTVPADNRPPRILPILPITVPNMLGQCGANVTFQGSADDCDLKSITFSPASGSFFPVGTTTVTVTAEDMAGHTSTTNFTVTVQDTEKPTITSPLDDISLQLDAGRCYATFTYIPTATDNCAGAVQTTVSPASGTQFAAGTTNTVTVTATDSNGNIQTKTFTVTVGGDTQAPTITSALTDITLPLEAGKCYATFIYVPTGADNCAGNVTMTVTPASGSQLAPGSVTTVVVTAKDAAGNVTTESFKVTVGGDLQPPTITSLLNDLTLPLDAGKCYATFNYTPTAMDNCAGTVFVTVNPASGSQLAPGSVTTVIVTAKDASGNITTASFKVTVGGDVQAPKITSALTDITLPLDAGKCYATFNYTPMATDNCAGAVHLTVSPASGSQLAPGSITTVIVTATDAAGNTTTGSFQVTVGGDVQPPTITSPLLNITLPVDTNHCYATFKYTPTAIDNCAGAVSVTVSPASGTQFAAGTTTTVTVTATDSAGNVMQKTFTVTVGRCPVTQTTFTMGGWGAVPNGSNPGTILWKYFSTVYPKGFYVGGNYKVTFTKASAVTDALPTTATPTVLTKNYKDPGSSLKNTFASQTVALKLNVDYSARGFLPVNLGSLGTMKVTSGPLTGWTVSQVLALCNTVLGGNKAALPAGLTVSGLNDIADAINNNFNDGLINNGYLTY